MKKISLLNVLFVAVLFVGVVSISGCSDQAATGVEATHHATGAVLGGHGLGETTAERHDDQTRQLRLNGSMMIDDVDAWMETDRTSRLTEYTVR